MNNRIRPLAFWEIQAFENKKKVKKFSYKNRDQKYNIRVPPKIIQIMRPPVKKYTLKVKNKPVLPPPAKVNTNVALTQNQLDTILNTLAKINNDKLVVLENRGVGASKPVSGQSERSSHAINVDKMPETNLKKTISKKKEDNPTKNSIKLPDNVIVEKDNKSTNENVAKIVEIKHLTNYEKKKLQWQKEKEEESKIEEFNPWGRPGAGAPIKDIHGDNLNDYLIRKDQTNPPADSAKPASVENQMFEDSLELLKKSQDIQNNTKPTMNSTFPTTSQNQDRNIEHVSMRSNLNFGSSGDNKMYDSDNQKKKKEWLAELDKQREEQRLIKKENDRRRHTSDGIWEDLHVENHHIVNVNPIKQTATHLVEDARSISAPNGENSFPSSQHPQQASQHPQIASHQSQHPQIVSKNPQQASQHPPIASQHPASTAPDDAALASRLAAATAALSPRFGSTFIRGQNAIIDDQTRDEMESKRKRHLQHQQYILEQVKEKENQKKNERERKIREEIEEDNKLKSQLERMQNQNDSEQKHKFHKLEEEERKMDMMKQALDKSHVDAERHKQEKRLQRLQIGGHDTSRLQSHYQDPELTPKRPPPAGFTRSKAMADCDTLNQNAPDEFDHAQEIYDPEPEHNTLLFQSCSTQTFQEMDQGAPIVPKLDLSIEYVAEEVHYHGVEGHQENSKQESVKHIVKISDRPKWGACKTNKYVKQSQKDPNSRKREKRLEERRQKMERGRKLQAEALAERAKVAEATKLLAKQHKKQKLRSNAPITMPTKTKAVTAAVTATVTAVASTTKRDEVKQKNSFSQRTVSPEAPPFRSTSPPLPTHRRGHNRAYIDRPLVTPSNGDFVPFIRTSMILEPQDAELPMSYSREPSATIRARNAYTQENAPGKYGEKMANRTDSRIDHNTGKHTKAPVIESLTKVRDHPTGRQDKILQQLCDLRKGLMMKQRELEMGLNVMPQQYELYNQ